MRLLLLTLAGLVFVSGCSTPKVINLSSTEVDHETFFVAGTETISVKKRNRVTLSSVNAVSFNKNNRFVITAENLSSSNFNFAPENLKVTHITKDHEFNACKIYTYEELKKKADSAATWAAIAVGLGAAAESYSAAYSGTTYTSGSYSGSGGYGTFSSSTYDSGKVAAQQRQINNDMQRDMANITERHKGKINELGNNLLRKTTVRPGNSYGGQVEVKIPYIQDGDLLRFDVSVQNENYKFYGTF